MSPSDNVTCPDRGQLVQFLLGHLTGPELEAVERHLSACDACVNTLHELNAVDTLVEIARSAREELPETEMVEGLIDRVRKLSSGLARGTEISAGAADGSTDERAEGIRCLFRPPEQPDELGRLANYRVLGHLGSGGMGVVFEAQDLQLKRTVALKVLPPSLGPGARGRFLQEARAAAAIDHENVVTIYQVGEDRGLAFLAMQRLEGETLESLVKREGTLPPDQIVEIGRQIAMGLRAAHAEGLIHRDVKPANIWMETGRARVKLLDFGVVRVLRDEPELTGSGMVMGTPAYMSPEQTVGERSDERSDLFSLGCVLYRLATGRLPFQGANALAMLRAIQTSSPRPPEELNPQVPRPLAELVMSLLEKEPDCRPQSADVVVESLQRIAEGDQELSIPHSPATVRKRDRKKKSTTAPRSRSAPARAARRWGTVVAALVLLGVPGYYAAPMVIRIAMNRGQLVIESSDPDIKIEVLQGGELVRIVEPGTGQSIDLTAGEYQIQLAGTAGGWALSTDKFTLTRGGREIVKVRRQAGDGESDEEIVKVLRQAGGGPSGRGMIELLRQGRAQDATETERLGIYAIDVTTGEVLLVRDKPIGDLTYFGSPSWSNDGQRILFDASPGKAWGETHLKMFYVAERKAVIKDLGLGNCPTLSPDGEHIAFLLNPGVVPDAPQGIWLMRADGSQRRYLGGYGVPKWSPDGKQLLIVSFSSPCRLSIMDVETAEQRPVRLAGHNFYSNPSWAGDGQTIVAVFRSGSDVGIALVDVTDSEQAQVKQILWKKGDRIDVSPLYPVYSPKTDLCVFVGGDENGETLYTVKPGQSDPPKRLEATRYDVKISRLSLSSDGRYVLFCNDRLNQLVEPGSTPASELTEPE